MSNQLEKIKELIDRRAAARLGGGNWKKSKNSLTAARQPVWAVAKKR